MVHKVCALNELSCVLGSCFGLLDGGKRGRGAGWVWYHIVDLR